MEHKAYVLCCDSLDEIKKQLFPVLEKYSYLFPVNKDGRILLKPNLNSNMNSLTGNTTDLRLLAVVIAFFKERGYKNITIAEGTNSGFYRNRIGVITRLAVDRLAAHFDVAVKDLNYSEPHRIVFDKGVYASVARDCVDADLFINMPKLKTHFEAGMSVCLKSLMGCLVGQENKKKTHLNLAENILNINRAVRPNLHIVDSLVAMEGLGPTRGTPVRLDTVLVGEDPYLLDLACARLAQFDYRKVITLALAEKKGWLTEDHHRSVAALGIKPYKRPFFPPIAGPFATFIHSPKRQKFFLKIRATWPFPYLASTRWFGHLLFVTGLRQDVFLEEEMDCQGLFVDESVCTNCGACKTVCPLGNNPALRAKNDETPCIECMYCYSVCPNKAIVFRGNTGFFAEQLRQYDELIRTLYKE